MLIPPHRIPAGMFDLLAHGQADTAVSAALRAGQLSKHLLLLRAVIEAAGPLRREAAAAGLDNSVRVLDEVQRRSPRAAAEVLAYPMVGAWIAHCHRRLRRRDTHEVPLWVDLGQLAAVAAAAAVRAGAEVDLVVPLRRGTVTLPGLGRATLPSGARWGAATVRGRPGDYRIEGRHGTVRIPTGPDGTPGWEPVHRHTVQDGDRRLAIVIDDVDPYRDTHGMAATGRLDPVVAARWSTDLHAAWRILVRHHPERADELAAGPLTIVPLAGGNGSTTTNATARDSVGAMALTLPESPVALALGLLHEHQHSKLGALLDLVPLYDQEDRRRFYSPWRSDPRPLGGLLQGAYAFGAVAGFWLRHATGATGLTPVPSACYEFARTRAQVAAALRTLRDSGSLTGAGQRFVAGLTETVDGLLRVPVPPRVTTLVRLMLDDHRQHWRLRNMAVDPIALERLADAWRRAAPRPAGPLPSRVVAGTPSSYADGHRYRLARRAAEHDGDHGTGADEALIAGDYPRAVAGYRAGIGAEPERLDLWAGLVVAGVRAGPAPAARAYDREPEVVLALHRRLRADAAGPADPAAVAAWLGG